MSADEKAQKRAVKRSMIAKEILATEMRYSEFLEVIVDVWLKPLQAAADKDSNILSREQINGIFSNVSLICDFHRQFARDMEECAKEWTDPDLAAAAAGEQTVAVDMSKSKQVASGKIPRGCFGALFKTFAPFLKMYTQYVGNHESASRLVAELENKRPKKFVQYSTAAVADPRNKGNTLFSLLIMPVQRVPRYKLLLSELIRNTDESHRDYADLLSAHSSIDKVAVHINEELRRSLNVTRVLALQARFSHAVDLLRPGRTLLHEGYATKRGRRGDDKYYFILFNDSLCYATSASASGGKLKMHRELAIDKSFAVTPVPETVAPDAPLVPVPAADDGAGAGLAASPSSLSSGGHGGDGDGASGSPTAAMTRQGVFPIQIVTADKSFVCFWELECERDRWLTLLNQCISEIHTKLESRASASAANANASASATATGAVRAVQEQHTPATVCKSCGSAVGVLDRFWCNLCGGICHANCCTTKLFVQWAGDARRVCNPCDEAARALANQRITKMRASLGGGAQADLASNSTYPSSSSPQTFNTTKSLSSPSSAATASGPIYGAAASPTNAAFATAPAALSTPARPPPPPAPPAGTTGAGAAVAATVATSPVPQSPPPPPRGASAASASASAASSPAPASASASPSPSPAPAGASRPPPPPMAAPTLAAARAAPAASVAAAAAAVAASAELEDADEPSWLPWLGSAAVTFAQGAALGVKALAVVAAKACRNRNKGGDNAAATATTSAASAAPGGALPPPLPPRRRAQGPTACDALERWTTVAAGFIGLALGAAATALSATGKKINASINSPPAAAAPALPQQQRPAPVHGAAAGAGARPPPPVLPPAGGPPGKKSA